MKQSNTIKELASALAAAQAEMPSIPFDATNPFLKNKYATLGSVIEHSRPILAKHGLAVCQVPISGMGTIGVETMLTHSSGEWLADTLSLPLGEEKGKSQAQVAGSIISYLRRYAWSSVLGLYADEDNDGETHRQGAPPRQSPPPAPQPKPAPAPAHEPPKPPAASNVTPANTSSLVATEKLKQTLLKRLEPQKALATEYFRKVDGCLLPNEDLEHLPLDFVPVDKPQFDLLIGAIQDFEAGQPAKRAFPANDYDTRRPKPTKAADPAPAPAQTPAATEGDEPWRAFPMPYGKNAGTPLASLEKKYLYGLWANYAVETEYNGKPKKPEQIAKDQTFRAHLDAAGAHYKFEKKA